jgi:hypothetical protein
VGAQGLDRRTQLDAARATSPSLFGGLPHFYEKAFAALSSERESATGGRPA